MKNSIKKSKEFKKVYEVKNSYATKNIVLYISKNIDTEYNRLGLSVSKKVGNSVVRHLLKRRLREIFRMNQEKIIKNNFYDFIIVARAGSDKTSFFVLNQDFIKLCKKHSIFLEIEND